MDKSINTVNVLHDTAMNYYDEATIAKVKGGEKSNAKYLSNLHKAYLLEKEAALKVPYDLESSWTRPVLLRSAASLAFMCNDIEEASRLVGLGLQVPKLSELIEQQLLQLKDQIKEKNIRPNHEKAPKQLEIKGILIFANAYDRVIMIETTATKTSFFSILVPEHMMDDVVLSYWKKNVIVNAKTSEKGAMMLEAIRLVA